MLVLSRREGERILIGEQIAIEITSIRGGRVSVGIVAPRDISIQRGELFHSPVILREPDSPGNEPDEGLLFATRVTETEKCTV